MNIHEYQAKAVLREFGVPVPRGVPAFSVDEALKGAKELGGPIWVVKAQIHAGGRGKAGGVKVVKSIEDVRKEAARMLGATLVTHQTGPHGREVRRLYVEEGARSVGVGEAMIAELVAFASRAGCIGVDALALPGARAAKNFFEESGFTARIIVMHRPAG